ncbi:hypothetical protein B0H63DRAFT_518228 [Podospora didyma]|uniref:Alcohol dehydrogenase-like C-terminal domain-containing protein n=1 Tax=Podospora didyma TaxID=330526 RepID=A0AAE0P8H7_9PEZI|nr:hypothetical protein B0H63DRAFT_518228 [Podospora didyma]
MPRAKNETMLALVWESKPFEMAVRDIEKPTVQMPEDGIPSSSAFRSPTRALVALPNDSSSDLEFLFLPDIFPTTWAGLNYAQFQSGYSVAVFDAGPVGLLCILSAFLRGASQIFAVDHVPERLHKAATLGAIPIDFTSPEGSPNEQILRRRPTGDKRYIDCVGEECLNAQLKPQQNFVINDAIHFCRGPIGRQHQAGISAAIPELWGKNLSIGSGNIGEVYFQELPRLFDLIKTKRARLDFIVSSEISIEDAPKAYERLDKKLETKVVIRFPRHRQPPEAKPEAKPAAAVEGAPPADVEKTNGSTGPKVSTATRVIPV